MTESTQPSNSTIPSASRPSIPGYGVPENTTELLTWDHVTNRLTQAKNFWIATADTHGQPHAVPVWAVWIGLTLYFSVGPRSARNIVANPKVTVHLEDGSDVVILEGDATTLNHVSSELAQALDDAYAQKYDYRPSAAGVELVGEGFFKLDLRVVFAWTAFPTDATRWLFPSTEKATVETHPSSSPD